MEYYHYNTITNSSTFTPFQLTDYQYFVWRTGGSGKEMTYLSADNNLGEAMDYFEMGYTNLWLLRRVALYERGQCLGKWTSLPKEPPMGHQNQFFIFCSDQYFDNRYQTPDGKFWHGFETAEAAEHFLYANPTLFKTFSIVCQLLEDITWH